jgi:hypothetical protein
MSNEASSLWSRRSYSSLRRAQTHGFRFARRTSRWPPRGDDIRRVLISACTLALAFSACGSELDRSNAESLIRSAYFGDGQGLVLQLRLTPAAEVQDHGVLGRYSVPFGDCSRSAIAWRDVPGSHDCVRALASLGIVECGTARLGNMAAEGPTIADIEPLPMGCGAAAGGADIRFPEGRPVVVATFASNAVGREACSTYLARSESSVLAADGSYAEWVSIAVTIPDSMTFGEVTGIADGSGDTKMVEFTSTAKVDRIAPLAGSSACLLGSGSWPPSDPRTSRATLRRFDDSWRVETVDWDGP